MCYSTKKEELAIALKKKYTIVIVIHNMQQVVARDLHQICSALKMITDMKRIGGQAADISGIAELTQGLLPKYRKAECG